MGAQSETTLKEQLPVAILSHSTARAYYLSLDPTRPDAARPCDDNVLECSSASVSVFRGLNTDYPGFGAGPLDILVSSEGKRRKGSQYRVHLCAAELPPGSFWKFNDRLYIASPELAFVQMGGSLDLAQMVVFGSNLCAKFFIDPETSEVVEREPITTPRKLGTYLNGISGVHGCAQARRALEWIAAGSASPMETKLRSLAGLSMHYGGHGFKRSVFNYRVDPGRFANLAEQQYFEIDVCWPEKKAGLEYLGEKEHQDLLADLRRIDALSALGWKIVVIDKRRLCDPDAFEVAMGQLARHLSRRVRKPEGWVEKNLALRKSLGIE